MNGTPPWSRADLDALEVWYRSRADAPLELDLLSARLGRAKTNICRKARELGLTDQQRRSTPARVAPSQEELRASRSAAAKKRIVEHGHPRGALGITHSDETRLKIGVASRRAAAGRSAETKRKIAAAATATKVARYGTGNPGLRAQANPYSRAKGGRRADLGGTYFRSGWEANYARYLNWLLAQGEIARWEYEPQTFVFHGVTRGAISYTPDFRITFLSGAQEFREVKGWMDSKSRTKLKRMKKFYPHETVVVVGQKEYSLIARTVAGAVPGWE